MLKSLRKALSIEDIRKRLLYTLAMLIVVRLGSQLPTPGVDPTFIQNFFAQQTGDAFNFFEAFTGGSFTRMSVFALSITPYITSSIIMQLLTIAIPKLEEMQKDGEDGRKKIAEFDNFRKRSEKEKSQMYEIGAKDIIEKILPVVDNFERGLSSIPEEEKNAPFVEGMEKIYKQLMTTLESVGVKPIEAVGQEFNPDFHNAVMHVEDEGLGENIIAEEFQKGYMYRESVVRHSMVKVAN